MRSPARLVRHCLIASSDPLLLSRYAASASRCALALRPRSMRVVSRRVHVAAVRPAAQPRDDVLGDGPPTPPRDEVQRQLQRSRCVDEPVPARAPSEEEGVRPGQLAVHAVSQSWTEFTRLQRLATLGTLALVFGGVPYVLPVTPLLCVLAYLQVRS